MRTLSFPVALVNFPIVSMRVDLATLESVFGKAHQDIPNPEIFTYPSPVKLWAFEFDCGLQIVLEFSTCISALSVMSSDFDPEHALRHLPIPHLELWIQNLKPAEAKKYVVRRLDDNGNEFDVASFLSLAGAKCLIAQLQLRKHKQLYWIEERSHMYPANAIDVVPLLERLRIAQYSTAKS
jgi:hypothetical protein